MNKINYGTNDFLDSSMDLIKERKSFVLEVKGTNAQKLRKTRRRATEFRSFDETRPSTLEKFVLFWKCLLISDFWSIYMLAKYNEMRVSWQEEEDKILISFQGP